MIQGDTGVVAVDDQARGVLDAQAHDTGSGQELLLLGVQASVLYLHSQTAICTYAGCHPETSLAEPGIDADGCGNGYRSRDPRYAGKAQRFTPEATVAVADKVMPGFGEQMRGISLNFVPTAILSRQVAVIRGKTLIINLPGQPKSIKETLEGVRDAEGRSMGRGSSPPCPIASTSSAGRIWRRWKRW